MKKRESSQADDNLLEGEVGGGLKRLSKAMAAAGVASRRACEEMIFAGRVTVNGRVVLVPQTLVSFGKDRIAVDQKMVVGEEEKHYYILNKPTGYICTNPLDGTKKIVLDLFSGVRARLFTVGRLDRDTSGLIIVTNDGHFANKVIHPSSRIVKEYLFHGQQEVSHEHLVSISSGAFVEETWVKPVKVTKVRKGTIKICVMEGKKREVRVLVEKAGLEVLSLQRIRIGGLILGRLEIGEWKEMSERERELIFT